MKFMSTIASTILEECGRFHAFFGHQPDFLFLGDKQMSEIDAMVTEMRRFGLLRECDPAPRAKFHGMEIFRVDAENHLSFGCRQPSPCG